MPLQPVSGALQGAVCVTIASVLILSVLALVAPILRRLSTRFGTLLIAGTPFALGCWFATLLPRVAEGEALIQTWEWLPELGVALSFRLDGLSVTFALLICFIGALVLLYTTSYMGNHPRLGVFLTTLIGFMAAMLGLVLAENMIVLFVFWELTSITSFLLIGFDFHRDEARRSALQALLVTGLGGLALLAGLILLGLASGGFEIGDALNASLHDHALYVPIVLLVFLGAFTKSAVFPFHLWLPNAMEAPSPVSALLHSATMVKAGVYLVMRLHPTLGGTLLWDETLTILGGATMLIAAYLATRQTKLKRILAYSTVSSLGTLMMLIGLGAAKAAATYLLAHAMFKGCLFLVAGSITKQTGEKDPERLGGLRRNMPLTAIAAGLGALSLAGMFPLLGFVGKELVLKAGLEHPEWATAATIATVVAAVLTVFAALLVGARPFFGARPESFADARDPDWRQLTGPLILAFAGVVASLTPSLFAEPIVKGMILSIEGPPLPEKMTLRPLELLWPPTAATFLSMLALGLGLGLYVGRGLYRRAIAPAAALDAVGPERAYDGIFAGLMGVAALQTRLLQNGSLQAYVRVTLLAAVIAGGAALLRSSALESVAGSLAIAPTWFDVVLILAIAGAGVAATLQRTALASVAVLGCVGFVIALVFAVYGAPDVAMTQFAVETLIVIIFVLVIFHLPRYSRLTGRFVRRLDALVAAAVGLLMAAFTLVVIERPEPESISTFYAERSVSEGFGRNVVNVILVDFRALDTLGEVYVIGVAAIGVYTLLRVRSAATREKQPAVPDVADPSAKESREEVAP